MERTKILLVEDDEDDYVIVRRSLSEAADWRFDLKWASTYDQALEEIETGAHDIYLFDYRLGAHNGVELVREAQSRGSTAPIIVLTGHGDREVDMEAMKAGAVDYLVKDELTTSALERAIRYALDRKRVETALHEAREGLEQRVQERTLALTEAVKALEREIVIRKRAERELVEKNQELKTFVDAVSHDLKNPIFSIHGFASLLIKRHGDDLDEKSRNYLKMIEASARQMNRLVCDLLNLSKIGYLLPELEDTPLMEVVQNAALSIRGRFKEKDVEVIVAQDLPAVCCDKDRIRQVFENMLSNAVKFSKKGEKTRIEIGFTANEGYYRFYVKDYGVGIDFEDQERIFDVFQRADACEGEGTGLGLAIVKKIIQQHGGSIWVKSTKGHGATFFFTLPTQQPSAQCAASSAA